MCSGAATAVCGYAVELLYTSHEKAWISWDMGESAFGLKFSTSLAQQYTALCLCFKNG